MEMNSMSRSHLYIDVADTIERMILNEEINVGEKLPSENEFAGSLAVSRNVVREALKSLKERGLIDIKTGKGAYVAVPRFDMFNDLLNRINKMNKVSFSDLLDLRYVLEVNAAGLAAERSDENDINKMEIALNKMRNSKTAEEWALNDISFHLAISDATHNIIYSSITYAVSDLYRKSFVNTFVKELVPVSVESHRKILNCIIIKDRKGSEEATKSLIEFHASQMHLHEKDK